MYNLTNDELLANVLNLQKKKRKKKSQGHFLHSSLFTKR